jgi:hypothetical protein
MKYWFEPRFEDKAKPKENNDVRDSEELNALATWEVSETGMYAAEN